MIYEFYNEKGDLQIAVKPNPGPQEMFLCSDADIVIYGGAAGGGKSFGLCLEVVKYINNPRYGAVIFRRTAKQVTGEGGLWARSTEIFPKAAATPKEGKLQWVFPSGAKVTFAHMEYEKDKYNWDGTEIPYIGFDELIHFTESQFFYMLTRNRSMCGVKPYVKATTNPDVDSWVANFIAWWINQETGYPIEERAGKLRWFYRLGEKLYWYNTKKEAMKKHPQLADVAEPKSVTFIPAKLEDNPPLIESDPNYRANLLAQGTVWRERLEKGNWKVKPEAGKVFNRTWFKFIDTLPIGKYIEVRSWDKASTEGGGAETAGVKIRYCYQQQIYVVVDLQHGHLSRHRREHLMRETAEADGEDCNIVIEQEPGSGGKDSAEISVANLAGFNVHAERATGDKVTRAQPYAAQVEAGNIYLLKGEWNKYFVDQHHNFPDGQLKDVVDAGAGGFNWLVRNKGGDWADVFASGATQEESGW